jgi:hypothetical protein
METQPWPLQLFMPLQLFFADLHSDVPLQEFTPAQCEVGAASAANDTAGKAEVNNIAAAAAIVALDSLLICMFDSSIVSRTQRYCCSPTETRPTPRLLLNYLSLCWIHLAAGRRVARASTATGCAIHKPLQHLDFSIVGR